MNIDLLYTERFNNLLQLFNACLVGEGENLAVDPARVKLGSDELDLKAIIKGTCHVYAAFVAHDRSRQSESVYMGTVEL